MVKRQNCHRHRSFQRHYITLPTPLILAQDYGFVTYDDRRTTLTQQSRIMMKTSESLLLEHNGYVDPTIDADQASIQDPQSDHGKILLSNLPIDPFYERKQYNLEACLGRSRLCWTP